MGVLAELRRRRALCLVRADTVPDPVGLAQALVAGGLPIVEFAFTTPDAPDLIARAAGVPGIVLGAGTVLTAGQARAAIDAGARFLLTPGVRPAVAEVAVAAGVPVVLGAMTPTEVAAAVDLGAAAVKVFPAARLGAEYFRDLRGPYPDVALVATGGLHEGNAADYLAAGALAVTAGSGVVPPSAVAAADHATIRSRARAFVAALGGRAAP